MKQGSQAKRIVLTAGQLGLLVLLFAVLGFVLPVYIAPSLANIFGITTPYEAERQVMSVRLSDRNVNDGESFQVGVSNPAADVRIQGLSYSCDYPDVRLAYRAGESLKEIPCETALELPQRASHEITVLTQKSAATFLPIELTLISGERTGRLSVVVAAAQSGISEMSTLPETTTATLQSFPGE